MEVLARIHLEDERPPPGPRQERAQRRGNGALADATFAGDDHELAACKLSQKVHEGGYVPETVRL